MPIELVQIRQELLPGLFQAQFLTTRLNAAYKITKLAMNQGLYSSIPPQWDHLFVPKAPAIIIHEVPLSVALTLGLGAAIIKNPTVSRRFWQGWLKA